MEFYTVEEIKDILKGSKSFAYKVIRELQAEFKHENKDVHMVRGRIPRWFFEKKYMNRVEE